MLQWTSKGAPIIPILTPNPDPTLTLTPKPQNPKTPKPQAAFLKLACWYNEYLIYELRYIEVNYPVRHKLGLPIQVLLLRMSNSCLPGPLSIGNLALSKALSILRVANSTVISLSSTALVAPLESVKVTNANYLLRLLPFLSSSKGILTFSILPNLLMTYSMSSSVISRERPISLIV